MMSGNATTSLHDQVDMKTGDCLHWQIGPLGLWVKRDDAEWQVASENQDGMDLVVASSQVPPPSGAAWTRWASGAEAQPVRIRPITPDRPVVVRPEQAFRILPKQTANVYISLPVWVRVELVAGNSSTTLIDMPTACLSNTWFGTLFEGTLCYWIGTTARRNVDGRDPAPHVATATMTIENTSDEELPLEKVCLNAENLSIYQGTHRLWTSTVHVTSSGLTKPQKIEVLDGPPAEAPGARLVSDPRRRARGGILGSTIGFLQSLPGARQMTTEE